ncbi:YecA/YgfB family protein [Azohydromonas lata]|uniref:UPF0149 family protein n=1 Tax=Azohydromonas lata TaxID=45677 RepID=A0ABU5I998_9BURK|nr:UPF0149 family protein [Azohydromonas lata]MDZ5455196.1 UPF0149 family protein [Azohydromonas lata]
MLAASTPVSLTEQELDQLQDALQAGPAAMKLEAMDGYFTALICGPVFVPPTEAVQQVLGDQFTFDNDEQAGEIIGLMMRHWNWIAAELQRTLTQPDVYLPVLLEDDAGVAHGNDWAHGFMRGMQARPGSWNELIASDKDGGCVVPMMMLVHEHDPDPGMRPPPIDAQKRREVIATMIAGATQCYRHFESARRAGAAGPAPLRRHVPKIGRNEPCPCGSGRKYKHCCAQTLH